MSKETLYILFRIARKDLGLSPAEALAWAKDDPFIWD